jgi:hypothetical protein
MEWTASVPVAATSHVSAPKPPNDPKRNNEGNEDVPMRETTEETKKKGQPTALNSKKQSKDKDKNVHWGENVVHEAENGKNRNKHNKGLQETQQEMVWKRKVTTVEVTAATTNAEAAKTHVVTETTKPKKQETTTNATKTTARQTTATTASTLAPEKTATTNTPKKTENEVKQQLQVQQRESKQKTQSGTGSRTHDRENRTNVATNRERRNVNR